MSQLMVAILACPTSGLTKVAAAGGLEDQVIRIEEHEHHAQSLFSRIITHKLTIVTDKSICPHTYMTPKPLLTLGLSSYEVNFAYEEAGQRKQALVKLRVCPQCAFKLNYRKEKQFQKARALAGPPPPPQQGQQAGGAGGAVVGGKRLRAQDLLDEGVLGAEEESGREGLVPPPAKLAAAAPAEQVATLPGDDTVWEVRPTQEATAEEEFDKYLDDMFM